MFGSRTDCRLAAIDWLRGLALLLMAFDHAGIFFTTGYGYHESRAARGPVPVVDASYAVRGLSHFGAPAFLLLSGACLALSTEKRRARETQTRLDLELLARGTLLVALDIFVISRLLGVPFVMLQVLYAIGGSMIAMVVLRRLFQRRPFLLLGLAVSLTLAAELVVGLVMAFSSGKPPAWASMLLTGGPLWDRRVIVAYPLVPWLCIMAIGWSVGTWLGSRKNVGGLVPRRLLSWGLLSLAVFAVVRAMNGFGNMGLLRKDGSLMQWVYLSKYPPSLAFVAYGAGVTLLLLALFCLIEERRGKNLLPLKPLQIIGQTPMLFYLVHFAAFVAVKNTTGIGSTHGLEAALIGALAVTLVLLPACWMYQSVRVRHPDWVLRYF